MARDRGARGEILLTLDLGNSTLDWMRVGAGAPERGRIDPDARDDLRRLLDPVPAAAVACSVVAQRLQPVAEVLAGRGVPLAIAGTDLPCPLELAYRDPRELGADRWVAAHAAFAEFGPSVVVDCGTAVTVDLVVEGRFLGGAIGPGWHAMARGLRTSAPTLPAPADETAALELVPVSSLGAVRAGLHLGFCGAVERLVAEIEAAGGVVPVTRVLTGGEAATYLRHGLLAFEHVPDLVHRGLQRLWAERP